MVPNGFRHEADFAYLPIFLFLFVFSGKIYEKICEMCHITVNKIAVFGDNGTITPGGVRIGK